MSRTVGAAEYYTRPLMHSTLKMLSLNVGKQQAVQHSVMNDVTLRDFEVIALSEPSSFVKEGKIITVPLGHMHWSKVIPTHIREGRRTIGSMGVQRQSTRRKHYSRGW